MLQGDTLPVERILPQEDPSAPINLLSFLPDGSVFLDTTSPVPDDFKSHQKLLRRVAVFVGIQAELVQENTHKLLDIIQTSALGG